MMRLEEQLVQDVIAVVNGLYAVEINSAIVKIDKTPPGFEGEFTIVIFPFAKLSKKNPEATANEIGAALVKKSIYIASFNVVKGFLNLSISDTFWIDTLVTISSQKDYGNLPSTGIKYVVEYGGPNTNKPLHLGHLRTLLLGYSTANILKAAGHEVHKVNIYNDRGIAICKSMVSYLRNGNDETPASAGIKGDHFVGKFYVEYDVMLKQEIGLMEMGNMSEKDAAKNAAIYSEAVDMLQKWEAGDKDVIALWNKMNNWVYEGFEETFKNIGIDFEKHYKESDYYLKGRDIVLEGLQKGIFFKKDDGSIWVDLTDAGLDQKVLLRADGTSVYITQDLGVAKERYHDFHMDTSVYVVANEQDYHFKVLKLVLQKLHAPYADGIYHLSYGMVDLPEGKMKSREGTVVDADDLIDEMKTEAREFLDASEKSAEFTDTEKEILSKQIGLAALKYFILKVDPKKRMLFNPKESIDLQGHTGPFIQYTYARIQSIFRKLAEAGFEPKQMQFNSLNATEKELIVSLYQYPAVIQTAALNYSPAEIANYCYHLAKQFNHFYAEHSVLKAETEEKMHLRISITRNVARTLKHGLQLLGIEAPEKM